MMIRVAILVFVLMVPPMSFQMQNRGEDSPNISTLDKLGNVVVVLTRPNPFRTDSRAVLGDELPASHAMKQFSRGSDRPVTDSSLIDNA